METLPWVASMYQQAGFNSVVVQTGTEDVDNKKLYGFHEAGPVTSTEAEESTATMDLTPIR